MMKVNGFSRIFLLSILSVFLTPIYGQISTPIQPKSESLGEVNQKISKQNFENLPSINVSSLLQEDAVTDSLKDVPWRFGEEIPVDYSLKNSGEWHELPNGDQLWTLKINSSEAVSLNFNFKSFYLPTGALFHIYSADRKQVLGAFTDQNNREDSLFNTTIIRSDAVILEYFEPANVTEQGVIELQSVVHGYRGFEKRAEFFDDSGPCNINVNCPEGNDWQAEKRAVVMILTAGNTRICSGTLINNARQDETPYVLTANHCGMTTTNVFIFNYDSPQCFPPVEPSTNQSISGCFLRANNSSFLASDFHLVELSSKPPANYNPFYAGWSRLNVPTKRGTGIHHPRGDVKKISIDYDRTESSGYYGKGDDHWAILKWEKGTTEDGSSGSALFNEQRRIVGQLHGGDASCRLDTVDYYGKFSFSWDTDSDPARQLKFWLDPDDIGIEVMDGFDPNLTIPSRDAQIAALGIDESVCTDTLYPNVVIKNRGGDVLTSLDVIYILDGQQIGSINWTGSLSTNQMDTLMIPAVPLTTGQHSFEVVCTSPNGSNDFYLLNNSLSTELFSVEDPYEADLEFTTDDFGNETQWELQNATGTVIQSFNNYPGVNGGQTYSHQFCLYNGCYQFIVFDTYGDGFCCSTGQGSYLLRSLPGNDTIDFNNTFSDFSDTTFFCVGDSCTILVDAIIRNVSESGASDGNISVQPIAGNPPFTYSWSNGSGSNNIDNLAVGAYQLTITDGLGCTGDFSFNVQISTSVEELRATQQGFDIFPNPANQQVIIEFNGISELDRTISLFDLAGKKIIEYDAERNVVQHTLDIHTLENGVYLLVVDSAEGRFTRKLVKN